MNTPSLPAAQAVTGPVEALAACCTPDTPEYALMTDVYDAVRGDVYTVGQDDMEWPIN